MIGQRFGRWLVLGELGKNRFRDTYWQCVCDCGVERACLGGHLRSGRTRSCGCFRVDVARSSKAKHGHARKGQRTSTYHSWRAMLMRCYEPEQYGERFKYYGGRGIKVSKRWHKFENFLTDMGERPNGQTLDRWPDKDGDYKPSNCRWATRREQRLNQRGRQSGTVQ